jgi:hypothetical protein
MNLLEIGYDMVTVQELDSCTTDLHSRQTDLGKDCRFVEIDLFANDQFKALHNLVDHKICGEETHWDEVGGLGDLIRIVGDIKT